MQNIVGMFVNTLALRNYPNGEKRFVDFLQEVRQNTIAAYENQDYPFEELVGKVEITRDISRNPLFDVMFSFENMDVTTAVIPDLKSTTVEYEGIKRAAKFDLTLTAIETSKNLFFNFEYCTKLFKEKTIKRLILYFKKLISSVTRDAGGKISEIEIITGKEKKQVLYDFNNTAAEYPKDKVIHELFAEQAEASPDNTAVVGPLPIKYRSYMTYKTYISYRELNHKANQLAHILLEKGVKPDTIVGIMPGQSIEMVIGILGILKAGGAYLPIDPGYPAERIKYMLADSGTNVLTTTSTLFEDRKIGRWEDRNNIETVLLDFSTLPPTHLHLSPATATSLAYVIYTSGSTGKPKGTLIQHHSLNNLCHWHIKYFSLTHHDRTAKFAGFGFDASVWEIFPCLVSGAAIYIIEEKIKSDINQLNCFFEKNKITITFLPTQICEQFMTLENNSLRILLTGGDQLKSYIKRNYQLVNNYGPTENTVVSSSFYVDSDYANIPIGKPIHNTKLYILSHDHQLQPVGVPGELYISGASLARGYLNQPGLTAEKFINPISQIPNKQRSYMSYIIYKTGDLTRWLPDGNIEFLGRIDNQVKIRGYRIELGEIERQLLTQEGMKDAIVLAKEDDYGAKELWTFVVCRENFELSQLKENLAKKLPGYMIPSYFLQIEKIPLTPNGKVDRKALFEKGQRLRSPIEYTAPRYKIERQIAAVWQQVLNVKAEEIGIYNNFFELGGDSIKIIQVARGLKDVLDRDIPITTFFEYPNIHSLAEFLTQEKLDQNSDSPDKTEEISRSKAIDDGRTRRGQRMNRRKN